jgi:hypothetical protein
MIIPSLLTIWRPGAGVDAATRREVARLTQLLVPPLEPNHQVGSARQGAIWAHELESSAKAFAFDAEAVNAAWAIARKPGRMAQIRRTCRAPADACFFELATGEEATLGIFTEGDRNNVLISLIVAWQGRLVIGGRPNRFKQRRFDFDRQIVRQESVLDVIGLHGTVIVPMLWAYLGTPSVATLKQTITREGHEALTSARFTRSAIHSYNRVTLNLPRDILEGGRPVQFHPGPGKRYHDVMAHTRLRRAPPPGSPRLLRWLYAWWFGRTYVQAHHRGNPELGTVVKERRITA